MFCNGSCESQQTFAGLKDILKISSRHGLKMSGKCMDKTNISVAILFRTSCKILQKIVWREARKVPWRSLKQDQCLLGCQHLHWLIRVNQSDFKALQMHLWCFYGVESQQFWTKYCQQFWTKYFLSQLTNFHFG